MARHVHVFPPDKKLRLSELRERLHYVKNHYQAQIARKIKCTRQTVHNVVWSPNPSPSSEYAAKIWDELENCLTKPEVEEEYRIAKSVVDALKKGSKVNLVMASEKFRVLARKLKKCGVDCTVVTTRGFPNRYTITPL